MVFNPPFVDHGPHEKHGFSTMFFSQFTAGTSCVSFASAPHCSRLVKLHIVAKMLKDYIYIYPLVISHSHGIDGPFIDGLPIKNGDFPWLC